MICVNFVLSLINKWREGELIASWFHFIFLYIYIYIGLEIISDDLDLLFNHKCCNCFTLLVNWLDQDVKLPVDSQVRMLYSGYSIMKILSYILITNEFLNNLVSSQGHDEQSSSNMSICSSFFMCILSVLVERNCSSMNFNDSLL